MTGPKLIRRNRTRLRRFLPWAARTESAADVERFIRGALVQFAAGDGFHAGIWRDGAPAGCIGLHPVDWLNRSASIGYWIDQHHEGHGLVTLAARAVTAYCFDVLTLHRVEIRCSTANDRSRGVAERLGFRHEGILRGAQMLPNGKATDLHVYGMLAPDWAAAPRVES